MLDLRAHRKDVLSKTIKSLQPKINALVAKTAIEDFESIAFSTEREKFVNVVKEKAIWLGCKPGDDITTQNLKSVEWEITKQCREKEEASRTTNGVVYETRELAEKARENIQQAQKLAQACKNADYQQVRRNLEKILAIDEIEPKGAVFDFVTQVKDLEIRARTVNGVTYETYEFAIKAKANRNTAQQVIKSYEAGTIKKDEFLQKIHEINQSEPQGSISDVFKDILVRFFAWKESDSTTVFMGMSFKNIAEMQVVQYEYFAFLEKYPPEASTWEELQKKIEDMRLTLHSDRESLSPQTKQLLEVFIERSEESINKKISAQEKKRAAEIETRKSDKRWLVFDIFALAAILFFPLVKVGGVPCTFWGLIQSILNGFSVGVCVLIIIYVFCIMVIVAELKDPPEAYAGIFTFAFLVAVVCLVGGSTYNTCIWLYTFLIPFIGFFIKK